MIVGGNIANMIETIVKIITARIITIIFADIGAVNK